jgi:Tol biopolymer transport system component
MTTDRYISSCPEATNQMSFQIVSFLALLIFLCSSSKGAMSAPFPASKVPEVSLSGAGDSFAPAFSANGRFLLFVSHANNLVTNDNDAPYLDVFLRDLLSNRITLVSVNSTGVGGGNADANYPSISSNGQYVAFATLASNLVASDTNNAVDVYWRDTLSGQTRLVSINALGSGPALGPLPSARYPLFSSYPIISAEGNWVFFESSASNLVAQPDNNAVPDVFARNVIGGLTVLVSANAANDGPGNARSELAAITPDGRLAAFISSSTNIVPGISGTNGHLFIRDLQLSRTICPSAGLTNYLPQPFDCSAPVLSKHDGAVVFKAQFRNLDPVVCYYQLETAELTVVNSNSLAATPIALSEDARLVAFDSTNGQVYLWDAQTGSNALVSVSTDGLSPSSFVSKAPQLTPDGRKALFISTSTTNFGFPLTTNRVNDEPHIYMRDLVAGITVLVTQDTNGQGNVVGLSFTDPALSPDGNSIAFTSGDEMLVPNDHNVASDVFLRNPASKSTMLMSERDPARPTTTGWGSSRLYPGGISSNGSVIVFTSLDGNFAPADTNHYSDAFVHRFQPEDTAIINPVSAGEAASFSYSLSPFVSADGNAATFLVISNVPASYHYIWHRDLLTGSNTAVASWLATVAGVQPQIPAPILPQAPCSANGRFVAFERGSGSVKQIYVADMTVPMQLSYVASHSIYSSGGNKSSINPAFSPDNNWALFQSLSTDLTTNVVNGTNYQLFAVIPPFDGKNPFPQQGTNVLRLISYSNAFRHPGLSADATGAVFSANSRFVAFYATPQNAIYRHDLYANPNSFSDSNANNLLVCTNCLNPSLNGNGTLVTYEAPRAGGTNDIYIKNLVSGEIQQLTVNRFGSAPANGHSSSPQISADGRFVVFASRADDLVENDHNLASDIFVRDRLLGLTFIVSLNQTGSASANASSTKPLLAGDGRSIAFQSLASDLVSGDYNHRRDIYLVRLSVTDSDADGLDDEWELAYFGDLTRDGTGDFDSDGQTDRAEFLAGTDPTNRGSVLMVTGFTALADGSRHLIWQSVPGKTYRVQFKDSLDAPWTSLTGSVTASGLTAFKVDSAPAPLHRFYRVITGQ